MDPLDIRRNRPAASNVQKPLRETASQTAGPYLHLGCLPSVGGVEGIFPSDLTCNRPSLDGPTIRIGGQVFEGDDEAVCRDVMLEFWQVDAGLWQRAATDFESGRFEIETLAGAPFLCLYVAARGINLGLHTRLYFADRAKANDADPLLAEVDAERRATLLAHPVEGRAGEYRFDVRLQGPRETVFFDV